MVVVDSSALIPLAWAGRLDLISATFEEIRTTPLVEEEVLVDGKRGTASLQAFLEGVSICETPPRAKDVASLEGIARADASVILLADDVDEVLLANDKGLIEVARSHGVECWWVTTLLLKCTKDGTVTATEATEILYDLVDSGMNLHPKVYAQVQRKLRELGE
jgi:predicted nucleic acid-binding protein